ncbi:MAG: CheR family methyltransferase [Coriobacteriales bacterium]|jgi:chemotaxis protein methyltransferase CheR
MGNSLIGKVKRRLSGRRIGLRGKPEEVSDSEYRAFLKIVDLIPELGMYKRHTVIHLQELAEKKGFENLEAYRSVLEEDADERADLRVNLTLKGTHFFRGDDWDFFNAECLSSFAGHDPADGKIRIWCAGCSSGEEAYSVIMSLLDYVDVSCIEVLATDYNDELVDKIREGRYYRMHYEEIPKRYRKYVDLRETRFYIKPELKEVVTACNQNLLSDEYPKGFDVIVCRNVIKFFAPDVIVRVKAKLAASLAEGGFLFTSADGNHKRVEFIDNPAALGLRQVGDRCIYQKVGD